MALLTKEELEKQRLKSNLAVLRSYRIKCAEDKLPPIPVPAAPAKKSFLSIVKDEENHKEKGA